MGPLRGIKVVELAGIGPGPFCGMILADLGAGVLRVDRADAVPDPLPDDPPPSPLNRSRRSIAVDLKQPSGRDTVLRLVEGADVLIEGFRPGVAERLGVGPDVCLERNPRLVYGRVTGFGQDGPLASRPGHDINFIALAGLLWHVGPPDRPPVPPLNLLGDFGGGGMLLAVGVLSALLEATRSGAGQVVDAAMVDGAALLMGMIHGMWATGAWSDQRGRNILDGGAPFYATYETKDGEYVAVGANEPRFYRRLVELLGFSVEELPDQMDTARWPETARRFAEVFRSKTQEEWCGVFDGEETCFAPVLPIPEAAQDPHNRARGTFVDVDGTLEAAPAPRFSRTPAGVQGPARHPGEDTRESLAAWGFEPSDIEQLLALGAVRQAGEGS